MALTACAKTETVYSTPPLNEHDQKHLSCATYPDLQAMVESLPEHVFLAGLDGVPVVTDGGHKWVRFDIANAREAITIKYGGVAGRTAHGECRADLNWLAGVWVRLQKQEP